MKKITSKISFLLFTILSIVTTSCEFDFSTNGKLDGYWRLAKVDTLETGGSLDLTKELIFWSFDSHLMEVVDRNEEYVDYLMHFKHNKDSLFLGEPHKYKQQTTDSLETDVKKLERFGINKIGEKFYVENLSGSKMIVSSTTLRLWFNKY